MIEPKKKKCKGTGKAKGFKSCGGMFYKRTYGLCQTCYRNWLLNTPEGKEQIEKATIKAKQPRLQIEAAKRQHKNEKRIKYLLVNVRTELHKYIKERDKGLPCISCGVPYSSDFQAGHFYKAELFSNLKFDANNINGQCPQCNLYKNGNESGYRVGLINRYGPDFVNSLDHKAAEFKKMNWKWEVEYLEDVRAKVKEISKKL